MQETTRLKKSGKPIRKKNHGTREKGALWPIRDTAGLRALVIRALEQHRSICEAEQTPFRFKLLAKACGLSAPWLHNFLSERNDPHEIQLKTWLGLSKLVGRGNAEEFDSLFMPQVRETLGFGYRRWLRESDRMASEGTGYRWERAATDFRAVAIARDGRDLTQRDQERDQLWSCVCAKLPSLAKDFEQIFEPPDWSEHRHAALTRVLEPFLLSAESGYVMRSWEEFSPRARRELIALGIRREKLLRPTSMPWARIAMAADLSTADFVARHGSDKQAKPSAFDILREHGYGSDAR